MSGREGWMDSIDFQHTLVQVPGNTVWQHMGDDPRARRRLVRVRGALTGADRATVRTNMRAVELLLSDVTTLREFAFGDTGLQYFARGYSSVEYREIRPIQADRGGKRWGVFVDIDFNCADPNIYDTLISNPVYTIPAIGAASAAHPLGP
jgi:hypothetical protein